MWTIKTLMFKIRDVSDEPEAIPIHYLKKQSTKQDKTKSTNIFLTFILAKILIERTFIFCKNT